MKWIFQSSVDYVELLQASRTPNSVYCKFRQKIMPDEAGQNVHVPNLNQTYHLLLAYGKTDNPGGKPCFSCHHKPRYSIHEIWMAYIVFQSYFGQCEPSPLPCHRYAISWNCKILVVSLHLLDANSDDFPTVISTPVNVAALASAKPASTNQSSSSKRLFVLLHGYYFIDSNN